MEAITIIVKLILVIAFFVGVVNSKDEAERQSKCLFTIALILFYFLFNYVL